MNSLQKKGSNDDGLLPHAPWVLYFDGASRKPAGKEFFEARGVHSLLYFAYMCVRDLFIGGG
jgi:hypothetical protein